MVGSSHEAAQSRDEASAGSRRLSGSPAAALQEAADDIDDEGDVLAGVLDGRAAGGALGNAGVEAPYSAEPGPPMTSILSPTARGAQDAGVGTA